jgi:hypothetical protein
MGPGCFTLHIMRYRYASDDKELLDRSHQPTRNAPFRAQMPPKWPLFRKTPKLRYQDLGEMILNSSFACILLEIKWLIWYKIYGLLF